MREAATQTTDDSTAHSMRYAWCVVGALTHLYAFSFIDRLTQYAFRSDAAVRYSLMIVISVACALAAVLLYAAWKPFVVSLERVHVWNGAHSG